MTATRASSLEPSPSKTPGRSAAPSKTLGRGPARRALLAALPLAAVVALSVPLVRALRPAARSPASGQAPSSPELGRRWGIDDLRVRRSAAGHLLDFRYRVTDAARAAAIQDRHARPYLVDLKSGRRLTVPTTPKAGALWNHGGVREGRTYFALFSNPGRLVRRGDHVSVVINQLEARDLVVE